MPPLCETAIRVISPGSIGRSRPILQDPLDQLNNPRLYRTWAVSFPSSQFILQNTSPSLYNTSPSVHKTSPSDRQIAIPISHSCPFDLSHSTLSRTLFHLSSLETCLSHVNPCRYLSCVCGHGTQIMSAGSTSIKDVPCLFRFLDDLHV